MRTATGQREQQQGRVLCARQRGISAVAAVVTAGHVSSCMDVLYAMECLRRMDEQVVNPRDRRVVVVQHSVFEVINRQYHEHKPCYAGRAVGDQAAATGVEPGNGVRPQQLPVRVLERCDMHLLDRLSLLRKPCRPNGDH